MDEIARDIVAAIIVGGGLTVAFFEIQIWRRCSYLPQRWIFLVKAIAALSASFTFSLSLLRMYDGGDIVSPYVGRPVFILLLTALALGAIYQNRTRGGC